MAHHHHHRRDTHTDTDDPHHIPVIHLRDKVGKYFDLQGDIPTHIVDHLNIRAQQQQQSSLTPHGQEGAAVQQLINSKSLSTLDKEALAAALLRGQHDDPKIAHAIQKHNSWGSKSPPYLAKHKGLQSALKELNDKVSQMRYDAYTKPFIELKSHALHASQKNRSFSPSSSQQSFLALSAPPDRRKELFYWGNQTLEAQDMPKVPKGDVHQRNSAGASDALVLKNKSASEFERKAILKQREEINELKRASERIRNSEKEAKDHQLQVKKIARDFRKMLIKRLKEKRNPQQAEIARCIDEDVIITFLEQYKGYSMSLDGLLRLLSAPMGKALPVFDDNDVDGSDLLSEDLDIPHIPEHRSHTPSLTPGEITGRDISPTTLRKYGSGFQFASRGTSRGTVTSSFGDARSPPRLATLRNANPGMAAVRSTGGLDTSSTEVGKQAIYAVRNQMKLESTLPSLQPLRILTDEQIEAIGHNKHELDRVLDRMVPPPGVVSLNRLSILVVPPSPGVGRSATPNTDMAAAAAAAAADSSDGRALTSLGNRKDEFPAMDWRDVLEGLDAQTERKQQTMLGIHNQNKQPFVNGGTVKFLDNGDDNISFTDTDPGLEGGSIQSNIIDDHVRSIAQDASKFVNDVRNELQPSALSMSVTATKILLPTVNAVTAPRAIKTRKHDAKILDVTEGVMEFMARPAQSPYASSPGTIPEATKVMCAGIPAGAGMPLWGSKRKDKKGRWMPGSKALERPFVSAT